MRLPMNAGSFQALLGPVILPIFSCNEACCSALHTQVLSAVLHASTGAAGTCHSSHVLLPEDMLLDTSYTGVARYSDKPSRQLLINL